MTYPTGTPVVQTMTPDKSGRPTRIRAVSGGTVLSQFHIRLMRSAPVTRCWCRPAKDIVGVGGPANSTTTYGYDSLNRLRTATEKTSTGAASASWAYRV